MHPIKRLCVFCGSNRGNDERYAAAAAQVGNALAQAGIGLVYGGGVIGLMGVVADAALAAGGEVIGIIPDGLMRREVGHRGPIDLRVVRSMHERKAMMADLSDGFVALPGGIGTFEELFEVWTWAQLGDHAKPCALLNVARFYDPLIAFIDQVTEAGFMKAKHRDMLMVESDFGILLDRIRAYEPPEVTKWIEASER